MDIMKRLMNGSLHLLRVAHMPPAGFVVRICARTLPYRELKVLDNFFISLVFGGVARPIAATPIVKT